MAKLVRSTQKIFAESANNNGVFGSLQAGNKQYSNDIATIQSLGAYNQGWNAATISSEKLPPLEEFQSLQYMMTSQLAYIFQQGVPEWDAGTTYYQGSMVKVIGSNGDYALYASLTNDNTGNQVTDGVNWKLVYNTVNGIQTVSNLSQAIDTSTSLYPSNNAVRDFVLANALPDQTGHNGQFLQTNGTTADWTNVDLSPYELLANKAQDLTSPSATTYPSTQAVANESSRIISIMDIKASPNYSNTITISGNFTAANNGVLYVQVAQGTRYCKGAINKIPIIDTSTQGTANITEMTNAYLLRKNDNVIWTSIGWNNCIFVPFN